MFKSGCEIRFEFRKVRTSNDLVDLQIMKKRMFISRWFLRVIRVCLDDGGEEKDEREGEEKGEKKEKEKKKGEKKRRRKKKRRKRGGGGGGGEEEEKEEKEGRVKKNMIRVVCKSWIIQLSEQTLN